MSLLCFTQYFDQLPVLKYFNKGGPVMYPLLFLSILGVAVILERAWYYHRVTINTPEFLDKIRKVLKQRKIKEAVLVCENYRGPIASILKHGLLNYGKGRDFIEKAIDSAGELEMARLERGLVWIATIQTIGPFLGFLGTVTGMIKAFEVIATHGLNNPSLVAIGISEALITTATGLIIAIPMNLFYNYFTTRVSKLVLEMQESSGMLVEYLSALEEEATQP
jgi:biopolymer transport protein ExbB